MMRPRIAREAARITSEVAVKHDVTVRQIRSAARFRWVVAARLELMQRLRAELDLSHEEIGNVVHRSTCMVWYWLSGGRARRTKGPLRQVLSEVSPTVERQAG